MRVYSASDEGGVVLHEPDERRPPSVLPGESEEEQARSVRDAASMDDACRSLSLIEGISSHEIVGPIPRRPDDRVDVLLAPIVEDGAPPDGARQPPPHGHAGATKPSRARSDEHVAFRQLPTESRIGADLHEPDRRTATRRGPCRADAAAARERAGRRRGPPSSSRRVPRRSGSRSSLLPRRAPGHQGVESGCDSQRCGSGTPSRPDRRRPGARTGTWNGPVATTTWLRRESHHPRSSRCSSRHAS